MDKGISAGMERGYCAAFTIMEHFDNPSMMCGISAKYGKAEILYAALVELCRRNGWHVQGDEITSELLRKYHLSVRICEKIIIR